MRSNLSIFSFFICTFDIKSNSYLAILRCISPYVFQKFYSSKFKSIMDFELVFIQSVWDLGHRFVSYFFLCLLFQFSFFFFFCGCPIAQAQFVEKVIPPQLNFTPLSKHSWEYLFVWINFWILNFVWLINVPIPFPMSYS